MTRVEKYRRYREEIANMKIETSSMKKEAAQQIEKRHNSSSGDLLKYEDVMEVHSVFKENKKKIRRIKLIPLTKFEMIYVVSAIILIAILLTGMIVVGKQIWR